MGTPRAQSLVGASWITIIIPVLGVILLFRVVTQDYFAMRTNPRSNMMAAVAASLARHGSAAAVDLSWHAPNATNINNLTQVMAGSDIYGWVYNNSQVPADEYGVYNWCNMPHVRKTEYKVPSSEYKLQYVEVVGCAIQLRAGSLQERADPQTPQTNGLRLQLLPGRILSLEL
jgi:hypothetical protein